MSRPIAADRARLLAASTLVVALLGAVPAAAAPDAMKALVGHRAVYEMTLKDRSERASVVDVGGRLVYEFSGSVCDGFSSRFRLVTRLTNTDGTSRISDMRTTSFEDGEGRSFDFVNQNLVDSQMVDDTKGKARHAGDKTRIDITTPAAKSLELAGGVKFPTEHMAAIIEAAKAGRSVVEIDLFDGSEGGGRAFRTTVVIGKEQTGADDTAAEPGAAKAGDLVTGKRRWPVEISYFDPEKGAADATPDYQLGFLLYENGISRRLRLAYGEFTLAGNLTSLDPIATAACK